MPKLAWIVLLVVISGGTASCYLLHRPVPEPEVSETTPPVPRTLPRAERDEEMLRRKLEGIGRARDLKPVPLPPPGSH